jgi:hypothetical protein
MQKKPVRHVGLQYSYVATQVSHSSLIIFLLSYVLLLGLGISKMDLIFDKWI